MRPANLVIWIGILAAFILIPFACRTRLSEREKAIDRRTQIAEECVAKAGVARIDLQATTDEYQRATQRMEKCFEDHKAELDELAKKAEFPTTKPQTTKPTTKPQTAKPTTKPATKPAPATSAKK